MTSYAILLSGLEIIHEGKIQYFRIALYAAITLLIGGGLWLVGFDLLESNHKMYRLGGMALLVIAAGFSLAVAWLGYWEYNTVLSMLE